MLYRYKHQWSHTSTAVARHRMSATAGSMYTNGDYID
jgi:hypothetical protein